MSEATPDKLECAPAIGNMPSLLPDYSGES